MDLYIAFLNIIRELRINFMQNNAKLDSFKKYQCRVTCLTNWGVARVGWPRAFGRTLADTWNSGIVGKYVQNAKQRYCRGNEKHGLPQLGVHWGVGTPVVGPDLGDSGPPLRCKKRGFGAGGYGGPRLRVNFINFFFGDRTET